MQVDLPRNDIETRASPDLSIIIVSWNTVQLLRECLESIFGQPQHVDYEVIVVDNASSDGSADMVATEFPAAVLVRNNSNDGFGGGCNLGISHSAGTHVLLLNSDTRILANALMRMVEFLREQTDCGAVGCQLINTDGSVQRACMRFPRLRTPLLYDTFVEKIFPNNREVRRYFMRDWDHSTSRDVEQPPGSCLAIRRRVLEEIGVLDERMFIFYHDVDLCYRMHAAGYRTCFLAEAKVVHHVGRSTQQLPTFAVVLHRDRLNYYRKRFGRWVSPYMKGLILLQATEYVIAMAWRLKLNRHFRRELKPALQTVWILMKS